jgi:hypothetical protein
MEEQRIQTYEEFWPFYVSQHLNSTCRNLHFVGTTIVYGVLAAAALISPAYLIAAPLVGYGFAWVGHFGFEKNRPATFKYPLWSLRADFRMHRYMLLGKMNNEISRAAKLYPATA